MPVEQGLSGGLHFALPGPAHAVHTVATPCHATQQAVPDMDLAHGVAGLKSLTSFMPSKDAAHRL